jgi:parallel beta-helix repeat protein
MLTASGKSNIEVIGGDWNGNRAGGASSGSGFTFTTCADVRIANLNIHSFSADVLSFTKGTRITVSGVTSGDTTNNCCSMVECNNCLVEYNRFHDAGSGCYFYCEDDGIAQTINNNVLRNNTVERVKQSGLSISLRGMEDIGRNNLIENNTCIDCGNDGFHPGINLGWSDDSGIRAAESCTVRYNLIYETGRYYSAGGCGGGLLLQGNRCSVYGNTIRDTTDAGAHVMGAYNNITENRISNVRTQCYPGILVTDGHHNEIVRNTIVNCSTGINLAPGSYNHLANNRIENMSEYWITINYQQSTANVIEKNTYVGSGRIYDGGTGTLVR